MRHLAELRQHGTQGEPRSRVNAIAVDHLGIELSFTADAGACDEPDGQEARLDDQVGEFGVEKGKHREATLAHAATLIQFAAERPRKSERWVL